MSKLNWEKEFDKKYYASKDGRLILLNGEKCPANEMSNALLEDIKCFICRLLTQERKQTEKAFGGCLNCYGKGYCTTLEFANLSADFFGDETKVYELPEMRFCKCDRGKELQKRFGQERQ